MPFKYAICGATPRQIGTLAGRKVTKVACGHNHTVAVDSLGKIWTWGFGGYGGALHVELY